MAVLTYRIVREHDEAILKRGITDINSGVRELAEYFIGGNYLATYLLIEDESDAPIATLKASEYETGFGDPDEDEDEDEDD